MTARMLIMEDFKGCAAPRRLIRSEPRLTLTQAFGIIAQELPEHATVLFKSYNSNVRPDIFPFCEPSYAIARNQPAEPTHLSYELRPDLQSAIIHRIKVAGERGMGIGTAMMASQYPFWRQMGVQSLAVQAHDMSEGFYENLGFRRAGKRMAEFKEEAYCLTYMRLDLTDPIQAARFENAIRRHPASILKNSKLDL